MPPKRREKKIHPSGPTRVPVLKASPMQLLSRPMARAQENHTHSLHEVLSLVLLGLGTLLFLALISYTPADVPSWFPLSSVASPRGPVLNFIGRSGAIVACSSYAF